MYQSVDLAETLQNIPWFLDLSKQDISELVRISDIRELNPGDELFHEGARDKNLYILLEGQITVITYVPTIGNHEIMTVEPLDVIGWASVTPVVRQGFCTTIAVNPCRLIYFDGEALRELCERNNRIGYVIMRRVANVVASWLLSTRLQLFDLIINKE